MARRRRALLWVGLAVLLVAALAVAAHRPLLRAAGTFLVVDEPLEPADAIVVLAGGTPFREAWAAELFRRGLAPRVIISRHLLTPRERELLALGIRALDDQGESRLALEKYGVPPDRIVAVGQAESITETELRTVGRLAREAGYRSVILVTSPWHTRRVKLIWSREAPADLRGVVAATRREPADGAEWWRQRRAAEELLHEYLGLAAIKLGISPALQ